MQLLWMLFSVRENGNFTKLIIALQHLAPTSAQKAGAKPTPPTSPKGEAFGIDHFMSADKAIGQKPLKAESSPLGEDV